MLASTLRCNLRSSAHRSPARAMKTPTVTTAKSQRTALQPLGGFNFINLNMGTSHRHVARSVTARRRKSKQRSLVGDAIRVADLKDGLALAFPLAATRLALVAAPGHRGLSGSGGSQSICNTLIRL